MNAINQILKNTSTSNSTSLDTSTSTDKSRNEIARTAYELNKILQPMEESMSLFNKFAWLYSGSTLMRLAIEAKETDKHGSPTKLFVWLVKQNLGYIKKSS